MVRHPVVEEDLQTILKAPLPWDALYGQTVLVTGANGILASYVVETLLFLNESTRGKPVQVLALVRDKARAENRFAHYRGRNDLHLIVQDASHPIPEDVHADYIVHAASQASPKYYGADPVGTLLPNVVGTYHLLQLARRSSAKAFLFLSSGEVYGRIPVGQVAITESDYGPSDPTEVRACYGEGKRAGETLCVAYSHQYGVPTRIARLSHTYGPGMRLDDGRVFADFVADVVNRRPIVLKSAGTAQRPFCYVSDAVAGFLTVFFKGASGQAYNVANAGACASVRELAELLVQLFPERALSVEYSGGKTDPSYLPSKNLIGVPDCSKVHALGWEPTVGLAEGFRRTVRSYDPA